MLAGVPVRISLFVCANLWNSRIISNMRNLTNEHDVE